MVRTTLGAFIALGMVTSVRAELLRNADFAVDANGDGVADGWAKNMHKGAAGRFAIERDEAGRFVQRIDHTNASKEWVRVSQLDLPARKNAIYVVAVDVKADGPWSALLYQFRSKPKHANDYDSHTLGSGGSTGWKRISKAIHTTDDATTFKLSLITHGKGTAWFRNASLVHLGDRPKLLIPRSNPPPTIDGRLDEAAWKDAASVTGLFSLDGKGKRPGAKTTIRTFTAGQALYVGFECAEPAIANQRIGDPTGKHPSWGEDTVEVFLQPGEGGCYYHVGVTPAGGMLSEVKGGHGRSYWASWFSRLGTEKTDLKAKAAAKRGKDRWTAELAFPLDTLGGVPAPGTVWRGNFARSRKITGLEQNTSWAYVAGTTYHQPGQFGDLIFAGPPAQPAVVVSAEEVLKATPPTRPTLVPRPRKLEWLADKPIPLTDRWRVIGPASPGEMLIASLQRQTGLKLTRADASWSGPAVRLVVKKQAHPEQYTLSVDDKGATLSAGDDRGLMYAAATWTQLVTKRADRAFLWPARIDDWPDLRWRCWHLIAPDTTDALAESKRVIGVMAGLKYNVVCLQIDNRLRYERRPVLSGGSNVPTKQQLRDLVAYAEKCGMEVIPMTQCWSHFNYFLTKKEFQHLTAHPKPVKGQRGSYWNYCPRHPEVHPLLFGMIEEQLECFPNARYYHVGLDEISFGPIGEHPLTKNTPPHEVFAEEVQRLYDFIVTKKGLKMCMWGDQLLKEHNGRAPHCTAKAIGKVPKDIIIFDWHYGASKRFPSVAFFKQQGFEVVASGWYEPINVYHFSKTAHEQDVLGYGGTTWWRMGGIHAQTRLKSAIPLTAENSWTCGRPTLEQIAYRPAEVYDRIRPATPPRAVERFCLIDLSAHFNEWLDDRDGTGWLTRDRQHALASLPRGRQIWSGVPFQIGPTHGRGPDAVVLADDAELSRYPQAAWQIPVSDRVDGIALLHTLSQPRRFTEHIYDRRRANPSHLGRYEIHYADGGRVELALDWEVNVCHWNHRLGSAHGHSAFVGRTAGGALVRLEYVVWTNPRPDVAVRSVDLISGKDQARPVLLAMTGIRYRR